MVGGGSMDQEEQAVMDTPVGAEPLPVTCSFPVSVKGVAVQDGKVLLLENERAEWELPGGKLELGEDPPDCVVREISEESGWLVTAGPVLDCWQCHIRRPRRRHRALWLLRNQ